MRALPGLALLLAGAARAATPEAQVEAAEHALIAAIAARDVAAYDRLVDNAYFAARPGLPDQGKRQIMDGYRDGKLILHGLEVHDLHVRVVGDTAVLSGTATSERELEGKTSHNEVRYVRVWIRRGGHWRALAQMAAPQGSGTP